VKYSFLMAGGGTGGHVVPAIAVARELRRRGHEPFFIGTRHGFEARLVPAEGFPLEWIEIGGLKNVGVMRRLRSLWQLPVAVWRCLRVIRRRRPAAVFSMGGYVAGPPMLAAILARVPIVVMEPNALPGFTSRRLHRFIRKALLTFEEARAEFAGADCEMTGLPVRPEFFAVEPRAPGNPFRVLVTGGSRGARTLNEAVRQALPTWPREEVHLTLQCGADSLAQCQAEFAQHQIRGEAVVFIESMADAFAAADLVIARAGAGSLAELAAAGKASILVPFPYAADDHQTKNAQAMERAGAAVLVPDAEMNGARLLSEIAALRAEPERLAQMAMNARKQAKPGAAERAAAILEELARLTPQRKAETIITRNVF